MPHGYLGDVYDGDAWKEFEQLEGPGFTLSRPRNYAVMLNIDWFQPYKNGMVYVGVTYLALMNLSREEI